MTDPLAERALAGPILEQVARDARAYVEALQAEPARRPNADEAAARFGGALPEGGAGAAGALDELFGGLDAAVRSSGPRMFHFVTGGTTPAALGADWLASALDQNAGLWTASPLAARLETVALDWLKDLFGLPAEWEGVLTTGATMANFTGLAAARSWWAERHGADLDADGFGGLPPVPVLSSGRVHSSAHKALSMLGIGRNAVRACAADGSGALDLDALHSSLRGLNGAPAILIANAGDVNTGAFDPIEAVADAAAEHDAWLHVDGAFGLFARVTPRAEGLAAGTERAHSVIADGHKWLNVPYDCGMAFVREPGRLARAFGGRAAYLGEGDRARPDFFERAPEMSRRARALAVWATLRAYGRGGHRAMVERHLDLARRLASRVDEAPELERLASVPLNIVLFRHRPPGMPEDELDDHNRRLGEAVLADGRVLMGTTVHDGRVGFRPAIVNWRTTEADVDAIVDATRELGARLVQ